MKLNNCCFAHLNNEKPKNEKEKMFTCIHGKTLSWDTARKNLGLSYGLRVFMDKDTKTPNT